MTAFIMQLFTSVKRKPQLLVEGRGLFLPHTKTKTVESVQTIKLLNLQTFNLFMLLLIFYKHSMIHR